MKCGIANQPGPFWSLGARLVKAPGLSFTALRVADERRRGAWR